MLCFKGFNKDLTCTCGLGTFQYRIGETFHAEKSRTRSTGLHSSEYVLEPLNWYSLRDGGRILMCEAGGDIDEDDGRIVSSTELTPLRELSGVEIVAEALAFMMRYPDVEWRVPRGRGCDTENDSAAAGENELLIVRGKRPMAKGRDGAVIGLCLDDGGEMAVRLLKIGKKYRPGIFYRLTRENGLEACV